MNKASSRSKHSFSLRTFSQIYQTTSFFDSPLNSDKFWKQIDVEEDEFLKQPKITENNFHYRNKTLFREWDSCTLSLRGTLLAFKKKKSSQYIEYIDLEEHMFRVEIIYPGNKKYSTKYPHGLSLYANGKSVEFFTKDKAQFGLWIGHLRNHCIMTNFNNNYNVTHLLGTGGYGKVHLIENLVNGNKYAGKFIRLSPAINKERQKTMIVNEIKILRKLEHGQIVKLYEVYEMPSQICLVMEFIDGEKLFNYITKNRMLSEKTTAYIMKQLLLILNYLEGQDIIHRDIKPENIIYTYNVPDKPILKVIDFGLATFHKKRDMVRKCGTAGYVAPEILNNQPYNFKVDLYSVGIIMYIW